jgi:membrane-associated protease RseP (regulator of RpoE activity)
VLYALGDPLSFVLLLVSYVVCVTLLGWVEALACARVGLREPGRRAPDPRRQVDPYGAVGALIAGLGWAKPVEVPGNRRGGRVAGALLAGPVLLLVLGLAALAGFGLSYGPVAGQAALLTNGAGVLPAGQEAWLLAGTMATYVGALSVVPLPPLPGGRALFAVAPQSGGWLKARYQLIDRNIGIAVLLALLILPLGSGPLLTGVLDAVLDPLVRLVSGA